jgi:ABC-2 type transport system permease protein
MRGAARLVRAFLLGASAAWAFVVRGLATYLSYRAKISLGLASLLVSVVTFASIGRVVSQAGTGFVERYGIDYTSFALLGILVHGVASSGLHSFRSAVRREQLQGTLEIMLSSRLPAWACVSLLGLGEMVLAASGAALFLLAAHALVGFRLALTPTALAAVALYAAFMTGLGIASAGIVLVSKEGEPVSWLFGTATSLVGGVYFPTDVLPSCLSRVAPFLPTTRALAVVRAAPGTRADAGSIAFLIVAAAASLAAGFAALRWGDRRARRAGTLGEY